MAFGQGNTTQFHSGGGSDATTHTSQSHTLGTDADVLYVYFAIEADGANRLPATASYGGQTLNRIDTTHTRQAHQTEGAWYVLYNPSGNNTVVIVLSSGPRWGGGAIIDYVAGTQTTPDDDEDLGGAGAKTLTSNITIADNGNHALVGYCCEIDENITWSGSATEIYAFSMNSAWRLEVVYEVFATTGAKTIVGTTVTGSGRTSGAIEVRDNAPAGGPTFTPIIMAY